MKISQDKNRMYQEVGYGYALYQSEGIDEDGYTTFRWKNLVPTIEKAEEWISDQSSPA